jgi:tetratricopeptide (TPR) repeat protein
MPQRIPAPSRTFLAVCIAATGFAFLAPPAAAQHDMPGMAEYPAAFDDPIPLATVGLGAFSRPVTTSSPEAQAYFDQGIQLLYAFTPPDAARSFREAEKRDPACAMCWFGEAWAWGPYLNGGMGAADAPRAYAAIRKALELADGRMTPVERALIDAMAVRYDPEHDADRRRELDRIYSDAMADVYRRFPDDLDVGFLYGESLMLMQPRRGPYHLADPEIQKIMTVFESVLARDITHPGACHLYVHATEMSAEPARAEACADLLGNSIPGASHINHMPSHTYNRIGRWGDAVRANIQAWHSDQKAAYGEGFAIYPSHNLHMLLFAASMDGQGAVAIQAGKDYGRLQDGGQFYHAMALLRFGRFEEILALNNAPEGTAFRGFWDFAHGYALLRSGDVPGARADLARVTDAMDADPGAQFRGHPASRLLGTVAGILEGEILRDEGDLAGAIAAQEHAVVLEDSLTYDEPEPLNFTARHWLGATLLEAGRAADAQAVYEASLEDHPHNGWSLFGLEQALRAQGKEAEADLAHVELEAAWARADHWIRASRYE